MQVNQIVLGNVPRWSNTIICSSNCCRDSGTLFIHTYLYFFQAITNYGVGIGQLQGPFPISSLQAGSLDTSVLTNMFVYSTVPVGHNNWELSQAHLVNSYKYSFPFPSNDVTASMPTHVSSVLALTHYACLFLAPLIATLEMGNNSETQ